jgi:hypothetical protein
LSPANLAIRFSRGGRVRTCGRVALFRRLLVFPRVVACRSRDLHAHSPARSNIDVNLASSRMFNLRATQHLRPFGPSTLRPRERLVLPDLSARSPPPARAARHAHLTAVTTLSRAGSQAVGAFPHPRLLALSSSPFMVTFRSPRMAPVRTIRSPLHLSMLRKTLVRSLPFGQFTHVSLGGTFDTCSSFDVHARLFSCGHPCI